MLKLDIDKITKISIILAMILISISILYIIVFLPIKAQIESNMKKYCDRCLQIAVEENYKEYEQTCGAIGIDGEKLNLKYLECSDGNSDKFLENPCVKKCIKGENFEETIRNRLKIRADYFIKKFDERRTKLEQLEELIRLRDKLEKKMRK